MTCQALTPQALTLRQNIDKLIGASPLLPVIKINSLETAVPLCRALWDGGLPLFEITLRGEHGLQAIAKLRAALPQAVIGAGTVLTVDQYRQAQQAGAQFVVTPGVTKELLEFGLQAQAPLLPGIATASELMCGYRLGYRRFKFFPAEVAGGTAALRALAGPFADVRFCPTGGIRQHTAAHYLGLDNVMAVGGTWLTPQASVTACDWAAITELVRRSLVALQTPNAC